MVFIVYSLVVCVFGENSGMEIIEIQRFFSGYYQKTHFCSRAITISDKNEILLLFWEKNREKHPINPKVRIVKNKEEAL